jgi:leucyl/phenylalanyl-tRNA---protein transferase
MPVFRLNERIVFPDPSLADEDGLLAVGGDLAPERLLLAYASGIFPWTAEGAFIPWYSPPWRMVLPPTAVHVSRSLRRVLNRGVFVVRYDTDFAGVVAGCATAPRPGQDGTWITPEMRAAYTTFHRLGYAHSAETWRGDELVGGIYGVTLGGVFFGESMFARASNASKVVFVTLAGALADLGYVLVDCQVYNDHLASLGAEEWSRRRFLRALKRGLAVQPTRVWPANER